MATFSVVVLTAAPPGQAGEAGGAFVKIDGREALLRSVELFLNRENVKHVQVVVAADDLEESKKRYGPHLSFAGVKMTGSGGMKWMDQVAAALEKVPADVSHVIVHDAARPAVPYSDIDAIMEAAEKHDAVMLASPVRSTLVEVDEGGNPVAYRLAPEFMNLLTPQVYSREKFAQMASTRQEVHPSQATLVKGSALNLRLGGSGDASLVKTMLNMLPKPKIKAPSSPFEEAQW